MCFSNWVQAWANRPVGRWRVQNSEFDDDQQPETAAEISKYYINS